MKAKELREWLFQHSLEDSWYLSSEGYLFQELFTIKDIEDFAKRAQGSSLKVLHVSNCDMENPPWVDFDVSKPETSAKKVSAARPVSQGHPAVPAPATRQVAFTRTHPKTWRTRSASRRRLKSASQESEAWSPEKIGGAIALACLAMLMLGLLMTSGGDDEGKAITVRDAYYAAQPFLKEQTSTNLKVDFPSEKADGVFVDQVRDDLYKMAGFVRVTNGNSSQFKGYQMITRHLGENQWELVYLKMGPRVVGSIPAELSGDERAFVAKR